MKLRGSIVAAVLAIGCLASAARADVEFSVGVGYSHLWLDGSGGAFDERDGIRVEPRVSFAPSDRWPELRLGFGLAFSGYSNDLDNGDVVAIGDDFILIHQDTFEEVTFIQPEFQLSWRATPFGNERWFAEPGVGVGAVIGNYWLGNRWWGWSDEEKSEWDATIAIRPFLRAGYQSEHWLTGLEASYLFGGSVDFTDNIGGDVREFYVGAFFGGRW